MRIYLIIPVLMSLFLLYAEGFGQVNPPVTNTVQSTAPSLNQLQVVELPPDSSSGTVMESNTAPTLNSTGQTAPSGSGNGPLHGSHNTRARAPKPGRNN